MTSVTQPAASGFWDELTQYLRDLHAALAPLTDSRAPLLGAGSFWWRAGEGSVHLSADEYRDYHRLLQRARDALAPRGDMSEAVIDSALQKAIFDVVDSPGTRAADVEVRIGQAVNECRSFIEKPPQEYECWLEVGGLATASLPAEFGATRFVLLGDQDIERLADLVRTEHTVDQTQKLDRIEQMAVDLLGHPVAIQRVHARDTEAAVSLATRKLSSTLECLNFFADVISRLYGVRFELVHDGSREILDSDSAEMYEIALAVTLGVLVSPEVKQVETLGALDVVPTKVVYRREAGTVPPMPPCGRRAL